MPFARPSFRILMVALVFVFVPLPTRCQGIPWNVVPLPVPNGFVDAQSGNVHLEISLGSMPERNGDPIQSRIVYDTTYYTYNGLPWNKTGSGWLPVTGSRHSGTSGLTPSGQTCTAFGLPAYPNGSVTFWGGFYFKDIHQTIHSTSNAPPYQTRQVNCYDNFGHSFGNSMDITSFNATDETGNSYQVSNYNKWTIWAPDGTRLFDNTGGIYSSDALPLDPNGNTGAGSQPNLSAGLPAGQYCGQTSPPTYTLTSTITTSSGSSGTYTFTCQVLNVSWIFNGTTYVGTQPFLTSLASPDGSSYSFTYDTGTTGNHTGILLSVTLPTGGAIAITYASTPPFRAATATFGGGTWNLGYVPGSPTTSQSTYTILAPPRYDSVSHTNLSDKTEFISTPGSCPYIQTAKYYSGSSTLLRTITYGYSCPGPPIPGTVTTTLNDTGQSSSITYQYGVGGLDYPPTLKQETDFTGTIVRTTKRVYNSFQKPTSVNVYSGDGTSGSPIASTVYTYDEYNANYCKNGVPMLTSFTGAYGHDDTNFGASNTSRGNVTTIQRLISGTTYSTTHMCYDTLGNVTQVVDANGNPTSYDYSENWADTYCIPSGTTTHAVATTITDALGHRTKKSLFTCTVLPQSNKDENDIQAGRNGTTYTYDALKRTLSINFADGGSDTYTYQDIAPAFSVTHTKAIASGVNLINTDIQDNLGRVAQTALTSDPSGTTYTATTYDALGHTNQTYNPTRCSPPTTSCGETTWGYTTTAYDAFGRPTTITAPDTAVTVTSYSGTTTTVTDPSGKARKSQTDALGRLTAVWEDPAGLNYETDYTYDTLDNLLTVNQKGNDPNSANWRTRTFTYNSLSHLLTAANPESGTITYAYDLNGNVLQKTSPAPNQTGSATVTLSYCYDVLNRLTAKAYTFSPSTPPTCTNGTLPSPVATYGYDAIAPPGCTLPTLTIGNGIGKRTGICDAAGAEAWSYDITAGTGWKITDARTTNSVTKATIVQNNLDGSIASLTYPSGRIITYTPNAAGRTVSAVDSTGPINYATAATYAPQGALASFQNGGSIVSIMYFNSRLQPCRISVKSSGTAPASCTDAVTGNVLDFSYNFSLGASDNGNVSAITNNRDTTRSQSFTYDALNRISTAKTTSTSGPNCWDEAFGYDPWSNLLTIGRVSGYTCSNEELLNSTATTKNQISGDTYDAAGNLINIPSIATYTYNAENQLTAAAGVTYTYDGDGKRVQKSSGKLYWYGMGSDPLDETDLAGNTNNASFNEYIFFGGKRIARRDSTDAVNYYFADHLGTARVVANSSGTVLDDSDFYPFGGERSITSSSGNAYKFTGKERDSESGLDNFGARFDSSSMGRFMSPDPGNIGVNRLNPQTWNAYSYSLNNPLSLTDPTGLYVCEDSEKCDSENDKAFAKSLADAQAAANKLTGDDRAAAQRAIDAYGDQGDDNGVNVRFDANVDHAVTEVSGVANGNKSADLNPNGQNINVTFNPNDVRGGGDIVAHEGSHVADGSAWVASGFAANKNPTNFTTEFNAYHVQFNILNALGVIQAPPGMKSAGASIPFSNPLSWRAGDTFKKVTPDLVQRIKEDYKNLDKPSFTKGAILQP